MAVRATELSHRVAALLGFLGVALGAFGAHWLKSFLIANDSVAIWQTAVLYQIVHSVAALWASERKPIVSWIWSAGILLFSGSLFLLALTGARWLGVITPVGGLFFLIGWSFFVIKPK